jgi:hypothetical protein
MQPGRHRRPALAALENTASNAFQLVRWVENIGNKDFSEKNRD